MLYFGKHKFLVQTFLIDSTPSIDSPPDADIPVVRREIPASYCIFLRISYVNQSTRKSKLIYSISSITIRCNIINSNKVIVLKFITKNTITENYLISFVLNFLKVVYFGIRFNIKKTILTTILYTSS